MSYLGNQPAIGKFTLCDDLTPDGSTTTFSLTSSSNAVVPGSVNAMLVSINGVIQAPATYSINGSQIIFSTAPGSGDVIDQIRVFGSVLNVGTVSDGTIGLAKLTATGTKDATTFLRGDNSFVVPSDNGKVLQVVTAQTSTEVTNTGTSYATTGLSASITPSSSSNKVLVLTAQAFSTFGDGSSSSGRRGLCALFRGTVAGTNLQAQFIGMNMVTSTTSTNDNSFNCVSFSYLDSPSTTSSQTYTVGMAASGACDVQAQQGGTDKSTITLLEIAG